MVVVTGRQWSLAVRPRAVFMIVRLATVGLAVS